MGIYDYSALREEARRSSMRSNVELALKVLQEAIRGDYVTESAGDKVARTKGRPTWLDGIKKRVLELGTELEYGRPYDPEFGDERECACEHDYYRHFDSYEDMLPVGCKYCPCGTFEEPDPSAGDLHSASDKS